MKESIYFIDRRVFSSAGRFNPLNPELNPI